MMPARRPKWTPATTSGAFLATVTLLPLAVVLSIVLLFHLGAVLVLVIGMAAAFAYGQRKRGQS